MTATLHKLTAGDGYTYLTRQVAVSDSTERGYDSLGDYYSVKGEAPGRWTGAGLASLGVQGTVTEQQMVNLFGAGVHPDAERIRYEAEAAGLSPRAVENAASLGQPFRVFEANQAWMDRLSQAYSAYNQVRGQAVNSPIAADERERIRTDVARAMFAETHGRDPRGDRELTSFVAQASRPVRSAVAGYDVTFSPVKSVSTLWAVAPRELSERIEAAHQAAVDDTVAWLEKHAAYTRSGTNGIAQIEVRGLIAAQFTHRDSRAGDPDLHTHVAVSNKVQAVDGRWLALDGRMIHRYLVAASEHYNTRLEAELVERIGARFVERQVAPGKRPIRELRGVDPVLNEQFSQRRRSITEHRAELVEAFRARNGRLPTPVELIKLSQQANLATREAKHDPKSLDEQREQWHEQAVQVLGSEEALEAMTAAATAGQLTPAGELTPSHAAELAAETLRVVEADRSQWSRHNIAAEAMRQLRYAGLATGDPASTDAAVQRVVEIALGPELSVPIGTDPEPGGAGVPEQLQRTDGSSVYRMAGGQLYTSRAVLEAEQTVVDAAGESGARAVTDRDVEIGMLEWSANNGGRALNASQRAMVDQVATTDRRVLLALAPAGTGKTTTMGALAAVWQGTGGTIVALAPQASAAQELAAQIPGVSSDTVDKLVHDLSGGIGAEPARWLREITAGTLVIVDEAGLASTRNLAAVTRFARQQGARVLLVGDDRQRAAAGAGGVLRDIDAVHGSLSLDEVMRFRDLRQGAVSLAMRAGDPGAVGYYVDRELLHSVSADEAADRVFAAWQRDRDAGIASIMIAPTLEQVTELNTRARAARLAAAAARGETIDAASRSLPNGETVSAGDLIVTKKNARTLSLGGTDFVKNNYRWLVEAINRDGSITATETSRGLTRTLPARYVDAGFVRLGYAATTASVQGLTVDGNAYTVLTADMSRNDLYPAMTRAKGDNHAYLVVAGTGDEHEVIRPESISPLTAAEMFAAIIERDGGDRSALTEIREAADPHTRLAVAAGAYGHALLAAVEAHAGDDLLGQLTDRAENAVPGVTGGHAWDTLRQHLAVIVLQGRDPIGELAAAAAARDLDGARDVAATLDWRLDPTGNHSLGAGPLPWLPAVPAAIGADPVWGDYLAARSDLVSELAGQIRRDVDTWTAHTAPAWAGPYLADRPLTEDLALWRASTGVVATDVRPAGERPRRIAHQQTHRELTAAAAVVAGDPADGTGRWHQLLTAVGAEQVTTDSYWPVLIARLTAADRAGAPVQNLITTALAERPLPSEAPAAVLWARIAPHVDLPDEPAAAGHALRPGWTADLEAALGVEHAEQIVADRLWPTIVTYVDGAAQHGQQPGDVVRAAAGLLTAVRAVTPRWQHPEVLLTNVVLLTDTEPVDPETVPLDPADADLLPPVDAHTLDTDTAVDPRLPSPVLPGPDEQHIPLPDQETPAAPDPAADTEPAAPDIERDRLLAVVAAAADFYRSQTPRSWVPGYLAGRGLGALTGRAGYAPAGWTTTVDELRGQGFTDRELLAAGIARTSARGTLIDAFRDRLVLPVHNQDGRVVAFTGRRNPELEDERVPKYINSPTTDLYAKTDLPYGLHPRAVQALRDGAGLAIAEGPLDAEAINLATGGRTVAIAPLGTALTAEQVATVDELAPVRGRRVVTALDADQAGTAAAVRAYSVLRDAGVDEPGAVAFPAGRKDPAETLAVDGPEQLAAAVDADPRPLADLVVDDVLSRWPAPTTPEIRVGALEEVAPVLAGMTGPQREHQAARVAAQLSLDSVTVTDAVMDHLPAAPLDPASPLGLPQRPTLSDAAAAEPAGPLAEVATDELRQRLAARSGELAAASEAARENTARIHALQAGEVVTAEVRRQQQLLQRASAVTEYRAQQARLEQLRQEWMKRAAAIAEAETRIADGGRRAARQEAERLAALRAEQERADIEVRTTGARLRDLEPLVGDPAQQQHTLTAAAEIREHGRELLAAAEQHQQRELAERLDRSPALTAAAENGQRDVDELTSELERRGETPADEPANHDMLLGRGTGSFIHQGVHEREPSLSDPHHEVER